MNHRCICVLLILCNCFINAVAQNRRGGAEEDLRVTFTVQQNIAQYHVFKSLNWQAPYFDDGRQLTTGLDAIKARGSAGFGIGVGLSKYLTERFSLRLIPTFVLNNRLLVYQYKVPGEGASFTMENYEAQKKVTGVLAELPVNVKFKSDRQSHFGLYITGGAKYSLHLKSTAQGEHLAERNFLSYDAGLGIDLFFNDFKLSPEIKYASSFGNLLKRNSNAFSNPIERLKLRQVTFSLYIE